jgi:hypothetical protein
MSTAPTQRLLGDDALVGRGLPVPVGLLADLDASLRALCNDAAARMSGIELDLENTSGDDTQQWLLAQLTITETLDRMLDRHQQKLVRLAKQLGITDKRLAEAWGITEPGAARRKQRATQQP